MSLFITFEGGEGSGKSTQARALYRRLSQLAIPVTLTHEPGGTPFGQRLRRWLKWSRDTGILPLTELLLFNASRAQLVANVIKPNLSKNCIVICDRYADSTLAYQGYGRGLNIDTIRAINNAATQGLNPDLTILLDIPIEIGFTRKKDKKHDRFEQENLAFHQRVREAYLQLAANEPQRWLVVDATQPRKKAGEVIWQRVSQMLAHR